VPHLHSSWTAAPAQQSNTASHTLHHHSCPILPHCCGYYVAAELAATASACLTCISLGQLHALIHGQLAGRDAAIVRKDLPHMLLSHVARELADVQLARQLLSA
jgi:hypothetical protein